MALNINGTTGISGVDGSASAPALQGTDSNTGVSFGADTVNINTGGSTKATVDSNGRLGIGTTSPSQQLTMASSSDSKINIRGHGSSTGYFIGMSSATDAQIYNAENGFIQFATNDTERLRILSDGRVVTQGLDGNTDITTTGTADTYDGVIFGGSQGPLRVTRTSATCIHLNRNGSGGSIISFRYGGGVVGSISNNANSLPSDRNYKKNISNLTLGLDLVNKLQPVSYHYKFDADSDPVMYGLIAQDVETALNDAGVAQNTAAILQYEDKKDEKDSDYSLDYTKLTPILINAVKELSAKITTLETKVAALEAG